MNSGIRTWLFDILQSISEIESYFEGRPKVYAAYESDIRTKKEL